MVYIHPFFLTVVTKKDHHERFWEIDAIRGIAIIMMITFHTFYDLAYFGDYPFSLHSGFWWYFARATASLFLILVGVSLTLSYARVKDMLPRSELWKKYIVRGAKIFCVGLLITLFTVMLLQGGMTERIIIFGILHCIGVSIILAYPLLTFRYINLVIGVLCILAGWYLTKITFTFNYLLWLGFRTPSLSMLDYVPLLPWFGLVTIGIYLGNTLYSNYTRKLRWRGRVAASFTMHESRSIKP